MDQAGTGSVIDHPQRPLPGPVQFSSKVPPLEVFVKTLRIIVVVSLGLIAVLWWALMPPRRPVVIGGQPPPPQCAGGSYADGGRCVCPVGAEWTGSMCGPGAPQPDTRHVTTVDLRHRR
jgi:hypothetical protein